MRKRYSSSRRLLLYKWSPLSEFNGGKNGHYYDIQNHASTFEDSSLSTRAKVGGPVGGLADLSGNNHHATQATEADKPILRETSSGIRYLEFDGVSQFLNVPTASFTVAGSSFFTWGHVIADPYRFYGSGAGNGKNIRTFTNSTILQILYTTDDGSILGSTYDTDAPFSSEDAVFTWSHINSGTDVEFNSRLANDGNDQSKTHSATGSMLALDELFIGKFATSFSNMRFYSGYCVDNGGTLTKESNENQFIAYCKGKGADV